MTTIVVQTQLNNFGPAVEITLEHRVKIWKDGQPVAQSEPKLVRLDADAKTTITLLVPVPNATLWTPEHPFLYVLPNSMRQSITAHNHSQG